MIPKHAQRWVNGQTGRPTARKRGNNEPTRSQLDIQTTSSRFLFFVLVDKEDAPAVKGTTRSPLQDVVAATRSFNFIISILASTTNRDRFDIYRKLEFDEMTLVGLQD